ncbi:MAG TPA: septum formation inhibitor Maf, partial [Verrucomicrobiales bacterium]|nr:septum formation inhibitor Maf [Verrucomicrobiales bacterium]
VGPKETILGKPGTADQACAQLAQLSGQAVRFLSGLFLLDATSGRSQVDIVVTTVRLRALEAGEIRRYVERDQPLDCAGAL